MVLAKTALFCFRFSLDILQSRCDKVKQAPTRYPPLHPPPLPQGQTRSNKVRRGSAAICGSLRVGLWSHKVPQGPTRSNKLQQASTSFNKVQQGPTRPNRSHKAQQSPIKSNVVSAARAQRIVDGAELCVTPRPNVVSAARVQRVVGGILYQARAECTARGPRAAGLGRRSGSRHS